MDGGRAQAVLAGAGQVRQGGLAEHIAQLRHLADADAGGEPRAEVLHPPQLHEPRPPPLQHPRHHQRHRRRSGRRAAGRPDHRPPGHGQPRGGGAGPAGHEAPPPPPPGRRAAAHAHVQRRAHGPPRRRPHGARRRRHAGDVPAGPRAVRRARRLPGATGQDAPMTRHGRT
uniref:Uncharacterized protein n=1 Tax=Oryza glumipatula TaxID=40148 RepID=A0A0D9Y9V9_9ORYZ